MAGELVKSNIAYSNIDKLVQKGSSITPPSKIFGLEPPRTWCYFFQKASLARQLKDWGSVYQITQVVLQKNLRPKDTNEWLPFLEGLIVSKKYSLAENLIRIALENEQVLSFGNNSNTFLDNFCKMRKRLEGAELKQYCIMKGS